MEESIKVRNVQLDGVRGIAILMVVLWHYVGCEFYPTGDWLPIFFIPVKLGWSGVDLFFVLSGFLITGILLDQRGQPILGFFRTFYGRRSFRILPLYFLFFGIFLCLYSLPIFQEPQFVELFAPGSIPLWSYATFTQNIFIGSSTSVGSGWLSMTWSLAVEEQFYLFVPFLVYFSSKRNLASIFVIFILSAPLLRCVAPGYHAFVGTLWRSDSLISGGLLALLIRWELFLNLVVTHTRFVFTLFFGFLVGAGVMAFFPTQFGVFKPFWLAGLYSLMILLAYLNTSSFLGKILAYRPLGFLGQLSFGIYMFHQAVVGLLYGFFRQAPPKIYTWSDAGLTFTAAWVTLLLAFVSYRYFEAPLLRLGQKRFHY